MLANLLSFFKPNNTQSGKNTITVQDVSFATVDDDKKTITGSVDLGTVPLNESYGNEAPFSSTYSCKYKNFYLLIDSYRVGSDDQEYHDVVRVLSDGDWERKPHQYKDPSQVKVFEQFCKECGVGYVKYPPSSVKV